MTSLRLLDALSIGGVAALVVLVVLARAAWLHRALRAAEATLAERQAEQAALTDLGRLALAGLRPGELRPQAAALIERVLGRDVRLTGPDDAAATGGTPAVAGPRREPALSGSTAAGRRAEPTLGGADAGLAPETAFAIAGRAAHHGALVVSGTLSPHQAAFVRTMAAALAVALEQGDADELLHPTLHDTLTGLPGRVLFQDRLDGALARSSRRGLTVAVLSCDLAGVHAVNDRFGHDAGDRLLRVVAERLALFVRPGDTVTRFGGDEFVVLCEGIGGRDDAAALARRLVAAVTEPADLGDTVVEVAISVGVALGTDPVTSEGLVAAADTALGRAKLAGRGIVEVVDTAVVPERHDGDAPGNVDGPEFAPRFAA